MNRFLCWNHVSQFLFLGNRLTSSFLVRQQEIGHEQFPSDRREVQRRSRAGLHLVGVYAAPTQEALDDGDVAVLRGVVQGCSSFVVGYVDVGLFAAELRRTS